MSRVLANKVKLRGISKNRVLACCAIIVVTLLGVLLFDGNNLDSQTSTINNAASNSVYVNTNNKANSTNNIIAQVAETRKILASEAAVPPVSNNKIEVPPLIETVQIKKQDLREKEHEYKQLDDIYASNHAKSLVFNGANLNTSSTNKSSTDVSMASEPTSSPKTPELYKNSDYLQSELSSPISRYELKAGSIIPATMINGLNSDLPGEVIAFVRSNVYDSISPRYLLVPQGSRLVGMYDSHVIYGQERVAVAWHRLIYPNGASINLKAMPGSDLEGYSGFHDQVDNKYWRLFGASFIMGVITGAMQYSQNNTNSNASNNPTIGQTMSGSLGQQLGQTGLSVTQKNLNVQPTLIIRPNYPFSIMITADMVLKPWRSL